MRFLLAREPNLWLYSLGQPLQVGGTMETEKIISEGWDAGAKIASGSTLKFEDGDSAEVMFVGDPVQVEGDYGKQNLFRVTCDGEEKRFYAGNPAFRAINNARKKAGDKFYCTVFLLARTGTGPKTAYSCTALREAEPAPAGNKDAPF